MTNYYVAYTETDDPERRANLLQRFVCEAEQSLSDDWLDQLGRFIEYSRDRIVHRVEYSNALDEAERMLKILTPCVRNGHNSTASGKSRKRLALAYLDLLEQWVAVHNHRGFIQEQDPVLREFEGWIRGPAQGLQSHFAMQERLLELRNRSFNSYFNAFDFRFVAAEDFRRDVDRRIAALHQEDVGKDVLLGKCCGTLGQAYAFRERMQPNAFFELSEEYLSQSLQFLPEDELVGTRMSVNFLSVLYWQQRRSNDALSIFARHHNITLEPDSPLAVRILSSWRQPGLDDWDKGTLLRLLADSEETVCDADIDALDSECRERCKSSAHPYQLVSKSMGYLCLRHGRNDAAQRWFQRSAEIAATQGFAVKATVLPVTGLEALLLKQQGKNEAYAEKRSEVAGIVRSLAAESPGFEDYITMIGGVEQLLLDMDQRDSAAVFRWMPFTYA